MVDCGTDWSGRLHRLAPTAIVLTHAHADHAAGLARGAPCPVYASAETLRLLDRYPIRDRRRVPVGKSTPIDGVTFRAFSVAHSVRAPAVGYRVSAASHSFFYLPDVADLPAASAALRGIDLYIGDGATVRRSMVRTRDGTSIGHAPIILQLDWCRKARVRAAIFTHCGSPIVRADPRQIERIVRGHGLERGVDARVAYDGLTLLLGASTAKPDRATRNYR